jgi:hypothetical protein
MITFYGVAERSDGRRLTMRITGSDRGSARGTAQARLNRIATRWNRSLRTEGWDGTASKVTSADSDCSQSSQPGVSAGLRA